MLKTFGGKANRSAESHTSNEGLGQDNKGVVVFRRKTYSALPAVLRVKILQRICFDRLGSRAERTAAQGDGRERLQRWALCTSERRQGVETGQPVGMKRHSSCREKAEELRTH